MLIVSIVIVNFVVKSNVFNTIFRVKFSQKEPGGGQRGLWVRVKIRFIVLKIRAMSQYGGGMGGVLSIKKDFDKPPC